MIYDGRKRTKKNITPKVMEKFQQNPLEMPPLCLGNERFINHHDPQ